MDRRKALALMGVSSLTLPHLVSCERDERGELKSKAEPEDDGMVDLLFVQEAQNVRFDGEQMTLMGVSPRTLFFADRPDEIAGYYTFNQFMAVVSEGPDSFKENPPNATLVVLEGEEFVNVVLKLSEKPILKGEDLFFPSVKFIQGEAPVKGGKVALFIDTVGHPASPGSAAGAHRRKKRRH